MEKKTTKKTPLRVLYLEDSPKDIEIIRESLVEAGFDLDMDCTMTEKEFISFLRRGTYDIILSDFKLPGFDAFGALQRAMEICPEVPFICVSGTIGEETAVDLLKQGAVDNVLKDGLMRLPAAINRALVEAKEKEKRRHAEEELRKSEERFKLLFEHAPDAFYLCDLKGIFTAGNIAAEKITGYKREELIGGSFLKLNLLSFDQLPKAATLLAKNVIGKSTGPDEFILKKKNGDKVFVEIITHPVKFEKGILILGIARDITERKKAEEQEKIFLQAIDGTFDCFLFTDLLGTITYANKATTEIFGYSLGELKKLNVTHLSVNPLDASKVVENIKNKGGWEGEIDCVRKNKELFFGHLSTSFIKDTKGNPTGMMGVLRDITERKQAEEELKKSEGKFRAIFDNTSDGMFLVDLKARKFFLCNAMCIKMLGYTQEEFLTLDIDDIHPSEDLTFINDQIGKFSRGEEGLRSDIRFKRKDGSIFFTDLRPAILTIAEKKYLLINFNDITERKIAEQALQESMERYKNLTKISPVGIFHTDEHGLTTYVNPKWCQISGLSFDDALGDGWLRAVHPEDKEKILTGWREATNGQRESFSEYRFVHPDGTIAWVIGQAIPERNLKNNIVGYLGTVTDITMSKRAEEALIYERNLLKALMDNIPDHIYFKDIDSRFMRLSKSLAERFGLSDPVQGQGKTDFDFFTEDHARPAFENEQEIMKTGRLIIGLEEKETWPDGSVTWVSTTKVPLRDFKGEIIGTFGISRNITERKQAEEALFESEKKYRTLITHSPDGIFIMDFSGAFLSVNKTMCDNLKYTEEELLSKKILDIVPQKYLLLHKDRLTAIMKGKQINEAIEYEVIGKDGIVHNVEVRSAPYYKDKELIGFQGIARDITEKKHADKTLRESEEKYRSIFENVQDVYYEALIDGTILEVSPSIEIISKGQYHRNELIGKSMYDFYAHTEERQALISALLERGSVTDSEVTLKNRDGSQIPCSISSKISFDDQGHPEKIIGSMRNITERKSLQNQLLQTQKVQSIGTLAGGIAHDFNNILGIILAYTSILERSRADEKKISKSTTAITQAVSRGAALVRQILTFARQTGALVKPLLIPDLVNEIVIMLKETFPKVIEFKTTIEKNVPLINADHSQMHQVLLNLCVNARDAMPKGGIIGFEVKTVESKTFIQQFPEAKSGRYVSISVSDTGIGMDEATKSRIFDPFFTTKEQGKGTGLGLSVVYGVIQEHHGFISVESTIGQGTTFHLYIPVPKEEKKTLEIKNIKAEEEQRGSETILFIEDEELLREVVQSTLESYGYKVLLATNGREAVEIYKKQYKDIALVLSDMGLPKLGGIDVYAILKEINPNIKIIFASGFISLETRSELFKEGVKGFIMKPYSVHEVLQMVRELLDEKEENNEQHHFSHSELPSEGL